MLTASVADTAKENIKYSHKQFSDFLNNQCNNSIFIQPTDSKEISNIISTLNMSKSSGPNSMPYKILNLLKKDISKQLADLFNLSLSSGVFSSLLKIAKLSTSSQKGFKARLLKLSSYLSFV